MNKYILVLSAMLLMPLHSNAQIEQTPQLQSADTQEDIERITVEGSDQLSVLRHSFYRAEEDFFNLFNELTTDESFQITCKPKERHAFTRIKKRTCESKFQDEEEYAMTQKAIFNGSRRNEDAWMARLPLQGEVYTQQRRLQKKQIAAMEALITENPELQQKLIKLNQAKQKYQDAKQGE